MMREPDYLNIQREALRLLISQRLGDVFALSLFDMRRIDLSGRAFVGKISEYEKRVGKKLYPVPEAMTVKQGDTCVILYDDRIKNQKRVNWSVAHEVGHVILCHTGKEECRKAEERRADIFASELLMPEAVILYLDEREGRRLSSKELSDYLPASESAIERRRKELDTRDPAYSPEGEELLALIFGGIKGEKGL